MNYVANVWFIITVNNLNQKQTTDTSQDVFEHFHTQEYFLESNTNLESNLEANTVIICTECLPCLGMWPCGGLCGGPL